MRAMSCGGTIFLSFLGVKNRMAIVAIAIPNSTKLTLEIISGSELRVPITPPLGAAEPIAGANCITIKIQPIPDMKPEMTL